MVAVKVQRFCKGEYHVGVGGSKGITRVSKFRNSIGRCAQGPRTSGGTIQDFCLEYIVSNRSCWLQANAVVIRARQEKITIRAGKAVGGTARRIILRKRDASWGRLQYPNDHLIATEGIGVRQAQQAISTGGTFTEFDGFAGLLRSIRKCVDRYIMRWRRGNTAVNESYLQIYRLWPQVPRAIGSALVALGQAVIRCLAVIHHSRRAGEAPAVGLHRGESRIAVRRRSRQETRFITNANFVEWHLHELIDRHIRARAAAVGHLQVAVHQPGIGQHIACGIVQLRPKGLPPPVAGSSYLAGRTIVDTQGGSGATGRAQVAILYRYIGIASCNFDQTGWRRGRGGNDQPLQLHIVCINSHLAIKGGMASCTFEGQALRDAYIFCKSAFKHLYGVASGRAKVDGCLDFDKEPLVVGSDHLSSQRAAFGAVVGRVGGDAVDCAICSARPPGEDEILARKGGIPEDIVIGQRNRLAASGEAKTNAAIVDIVIADYGSI